MKDGHTRKLTRKDTRGGGFLVSHAATLVFASGPLGGTEVALDKERVTVGRGSGVDVSLDDSSVSSQHAAFELAKAGFQLRDLGSTNGVRVNGCPAMLAELKHGDRIEIGSLRFSYRVEARAARTPTHQLDED
jgi:pSer/pThr/pTyr-binding forkhead associated (FHA) protein